MRHVLTQAVFNIGAMGNASAPTTLEQGNPDGGVDGASCGVLPCRMAAVDYLAPCLVETGALETRSRYVGRRQISIQWRLHNRHVTNVYGRLWWKIGHVRRGEFM